MQSVKFYGATAELINQRGNLEVVSENKETGEVCFRVINKNNRRKTVKEKTLKEKKFRQCWTKPVWTKKHTGHYLLFIVKPLAQQFTKELSGLLLAFVIGFLTSAIISFLF